MRNEQTMQRMSSRRPKSAAATIACCVLALSKAQDASDASPKNLNLGFVHAFAPLVLPHAIHSAHLISSNVERKSTCLFVASAPKRGKRAFAGSNDGSGEDTTQFRREGGAESIGLASGLGAETPLLADSESISSILDDGNGHINAELASQVWEWENEHLKNMTDASSAEAGNPFPAKDIQFSTRKGLKMVEQIARDLLALQSEETTVTYSDLVQEGVLSLIKSLAKYDPAHPKAHGSFESYARYRILRGMEKALADAAYRPLRLPNYVYDTLKRAQLETKQLANELDRDPTLAEVAARVRVTPSKLRFYSLAARTSLPVESTVEIYDPDSVQINYADEDTYQSNLSVSPSNDGAYLHSGEIEEVMGVEEEEWTEPKTMQVAPLRDFIADDAENPEQMSLQEMMRVDIDELLSQTLDKREVEIIRLKFGLDGGTTYSVDKDEEGSRGNGTNRNGLTFTDIGKRVGLSPSRVAQVEQSALDKLRRNYSSAFVEEWLEDEHADEVSM